MSNTRYIELSSAFRDRNKFPNPAQFEVNVSQSGSAPKNGVNAIDPVLSSFPELIWSPAFNIVGGGEAMFITGAIDLSAGAANQIGTGSGPSTSGGKYIVRFTTATDTPQRARDFYINSVIEAATAGTPERRRITGYRFLGVDGADSVVEITTDTPFSTAVINAAAITISNPSDSSVTTDDYVFIPTGISADDFYRGVRMERIVPGDTAPSQFGTVVSYNGETGVARVEAITGMTAISAISPDDIFQIRRAEPAQTGTLAAGSTTTTAILPLGVSMANGTYIGYYIRTNMTALGAAPYTNPEGIVDPSDPNVMDVHTLGGNQGGDVRRITAYNGTTRTVTVTPPFSVAPGAVAYELLSFSRDNVVPLNYTGSWTSQQQEVCYEVELINLILPNRPLVTGSRITFYPYVYVQFQNLTAASGRNTNIIYSNNPNSSTALFRASIDDVPNLTTSTFVKIDGDGMIQTIKFRPNDNFRFRVFLPITGENFETDLSDDLSPLPPDPLVQISAVFAVTRVQ